MDILSFSAWLAETPASLLIQTEAWIVPTVQSIHILAIGIVMASMAMLDLRLAGLLGREQSVRQMALRFLPWLWWALSVLIVTGIIMIIGEPARELGNTIFWLKMKLLILAVLLTAPLMPLLQDRPYREMDAGRRAIVRTCALLSLCCWIAIVACGRWIAYTQ